MKTAQGFTLIELLVTVAVAAVLFGIAAPSFTNMIRDNRQVSATNSLLRSIGIARSEAIKRGLSVTLCAGTASGTTGTCSTNWTGGWIVFANINGSSVTSFDTNDVLLEVHPALDASQTLKSSLGGSIAFGGNGIMTTTTAGTFTFCDPRGAGSADAVVISAVGNARASNKDVNNNSLTCP